jgi:MFS family permease
MTGPPIKTLSDAEKVRRLPWYYAHSGCNAVFSALTWFGPVFVLFLSELGLPKTRIGIVLSFLPFSGMLALVIAPTVARLGVKRVFIACWGIRKVVTACLLLTPWVLSRYGADGAFYYVLLCMALFAVLRAIAETGWYPWALEIVPPAVRGRMYGVNNVIALLATSTALLIASRILDESQGLTPYLLLLGLGVGAGILCVIFAFPIPGGAPGRLRQTAHWQAVREALSDRKLVLYLIYSALTMVTVQAVFVAFVPLLMKDEVGLPSSRIVLLEVAGSVVGVLSSYAWGWWADRKGTSSLRLVLLMMGVLPVLWMSLPRQHEWSFFCALAIACVAGATYNGWWITDQRMLYVDIVPEDRRTEYLALYYAWIGFVGGCGPLVTGSLLDGFSSLRGSWGFLPIDPYTPLLAGSIAAITVSALVLQRLRARLAREPLVTPQDP